MGLAAIIAIIAGLAPALGLAGDIVKFDTVLVPVVAQQIQQRNGGGNCCQCCCNQKRLVMMAKLPKHKAKPHGHAH